MKTTLNASNDVTVSPAARDKNSQPADGKSANEAVVQYAQYKDDPGATVDLRLSGSNCRFEDGTKSKDKVPLVDGSVTVPFYSTTSNYVTLTAYLTANRKIYDYHDFHFAQMIEKVDLEVVPGYDTAPPDGATPDMVQATVYGYDGKGMAYVPVTFQPDPQATLSPPQPGTTQFDGTAIVSIANKAEGDVQITASAGGVTSNPVAVHFSASALMVKTVGLTFSPRTAPADGKTALRTRAVVTMSNGRAAPDGTQVTFTLSNGATANPSPAPTSAGIATTWITSTAVGESDVMARGGRVSSPPSTVQFTVPPSAGKSKAG